MKLLLPFLLCTPALATPVVIDFEDAPSNGIPTTFYANRGVSFLRFTSPQVGGYGNGLMYPMLLSPPPASGWSLSAFANLAGYIGDFEVVFAQPQRYFALDAFAADGPFTATAYSGPNIMAQQVFPAAPDRTYTQILLTTSAPLSFTRVVIDVQNTVPASSGVNGPTTFDNMTFDTVPAPAACAPLFIAAAAMTRRRRS